EAGTCFGFIEGVAESSSSKDRVCWRGDGDVPSLLEKLCENNIRVQGHSTRTEITCHSPAVCMTYHVLIQLTVPAALSMSLHLRFSIGSTPTRLRQLKPVGRKFQPGDCVSQRNDVGFAFDFKLSCGVELSHS